MITRQPALTTIIAALTGCASNQDPPSAGFRPQIAELHFVKEYSPGGNRIDFADPMCVAVRAECTGVSDHGTQHALQIPGAVCPTRRADGQRWVRAQGTARVPWPCRSSGELWFDVLVPNTGCRHANSRYAATNDRNGRISATLVLDCRSGG